MQFLYEAVDVAGQVVMGKMEAANEGEVQRNLQQMGYRSQLVAPAAPVVASSFDRTNAFPTMKEYTSIGTVAPEQGHARTVAAAPRHAEPLGRRSGSVVMAGHAAGVVARQGMTKTVARPGIPFIVPRPDASKLAGVSTRDMMMFFRQCASLVHSGMSIFGALDNLAPRTRNKNLAKTASEMAGAARAGGRISEVMRKYPRIYPDHIIGTVAAGETGGFIDIALEEIAYNYEQNIALYRGSWIPKLMATQSLLCLALVAFLMPAFFSHTGNVAAFVTSYLRLTLFFAVPVAAGLYVAARVAANQLQLPEFRRLRDSLSLRVPPFGDLQRQAAIAAFLRMLRRLFHAGVAPITAWEGAMNTSSNVVIRERLAASYELMQQGSTLADAFSATGLFADQVEQLVATGQQSGQVVEMLDQATDYYQEKVTEAAGKSRFMMLRLGILAMLILGGAASLWLAQSYFSGVMHYTDGWAD